MTPAVGCALLAGGRGSRMGGAAKGLELVAGRRIIDRLVDAAVAALGSLPLLVANAPEAARWAPDLRTVPDRRPDEGPLGGIGTALITLRNPVVCIAWDMPFVTPALIRRLADGLRAADLVLPESGGRRGVEPLCAGYGPACLEPIDAALAGGERRAFGWPHQLRVERIGRAEIATLGDPEFLFLNVNDAADLARAEALAAGETR